MGRRAKGDPVGSAVGRSARRAGNDAGARSAMAAGGTKLPARDRTRPRGLALAPPFRPVLTFDSRAGRGGASTIAHSGASGSAFTRCALFSQRGAEVGGPAEGSGS